MTPLHSACANGDTAIVAMLCDVSGVSFTVVDMQGLIPAQLVPNNLPDSSSVRELIRMCEYGG